MLFIITPSGRSRLVQIHIQRPLQDIYGNPPPMSESGKDTRPNHPMAQQALDDEGIKIHKGSVRRESDWRSNIPIKVVVADERHLLVEGIRSALRSPEIELAAICSKISKVLDVVGRHAPDVLVIDGSVSCEVLVRMKGANISTNTVVTLDRIECANFLDLTNSGAIGVISVKAGRNDFLDCVRSAASGKYWIESCVAKHVVETTLSASNNDVSVLTNQQQRIVEMVNAGKRNKEIA
jgi:DNA-binding NarL/FixJ family response regulator